MVRRRSRLSSRRRDVSSGQGLSQSIERVHQRRRHEGCGQDRDVGYRVVHGDTGTDRGASIHAQINVDIRQVESGLRTGMSNVFEDKKKERLVSIIRVVCQSRELTWH